MDKENTPKHENDYSLVQRVLNYDKYAFKFLYEQYADLIFAFIKHHLKDERTDIEDIWQETLLASINAMPKYKGNSQLITWLYGIARHKIADYFRRKGKKLVSYSGGNINNIDDIIDSQSLPEDYTSHQSTRIYVVETLGHISNDYRSVLVRKYIYEDSIEKISNDLGKTYKATESLLSRARKAFKTEFVKIIKEYENK